LTSTQKQRLKAWIAALLWLGLIAAESTNLGSADNTSRILYPILHFLAGVSPTRFLVWHFYIRKGGHFFGYSALSFLLFRAWRATLPCASPSRWSMQWARISFFMTALVACLDEWHQTYLPSRTGNLHDVLLDGSGALVAQIVIFLLLYPWGSATRQKIPV
jgi:VanZ family protein